MCWLAVNLLVGCAQSPPRSQEQPEAATGWQKRAEVHFAHRAVVSAHPLATQAGWSVLQQGGHAVDAAVATELVLAVVEPQSSGLGGGGFAVVHDGRHTWSLDGRETAAQSTDAQLFMVNGRVMSFDEARLSPLAVGVPGTVGLLWHMHQQHGRLPWPTLVQPAIDLAEQGFPISPRLHGLLQNDPWLRDDAQARALFYEADGRAKATGTMLRNPELAWMLRRIAQQGPLALQQGQVAQAMLQRIQAGQPGGSRLSERDLQRHAVRTEPALCWDWMTRTEASGPVWHVCGAPPPASGTLAVGQILGLLEAGPSDWHSLALGTAWAHAYTEAARLAFADRAQYVADPGFVSPPGHSWNSLLAPSYLKDRARLLGPTRQQRVEPGRPTAAPLAWGQMPEQAEAGTTHVNVIDGQGAAVSMTHSIESAFGSRKMVNTGQGRLGGFLLNHQLTDFALNPLDERGQSLANSPGPGKRPRSSMTPVLIFEKKADAGDLELRMALGSAGGPFIIHHVAQTLWAMKHWGMQPQAASEMPRWGITDAQGPLWLEVGTAAQQWSFELQQLGHAVRTGQLTSGVQLLFRDAQGQWAAGTDPRREGLALGD
jgi:gamma-glutamyltranspeptidase/glutathione hydrolase